MEQIRENIFIKIAKLLATSQIKSKMSKLNTEPDLQSSIESLKFHLDKADKQLRKICKQHPDYPECKEKGISK